MNYKAIRTFADGENGRAWPMGHGGHAYKAGDVYPKEGFEPAEEHIAYLLGSGNKLKAPCIEAVKENPDNQQAAPLAKMKKAELEAMAVGMGLDAQGKTVKELIALIEQAMAGKEGGADDGDGGTGENQTPPGADGQQQQGCAP